MAASDVRVIEVPLPAGSRVLGWYPRVNLADAFAVPLPVGNVADAERLARHMLEHQPRWVGMLMRVRDALVARLGLKTAAALTRDNGAGKARRILFFRIYETHGDEIVLGEDDRHLDFRVSVMRLTRPTPEGARPFVVVSTVVQCHNRLGRAYLALIAPFHRQVVQAGLRRAARTGWPP